MCQCLCHSCEGSLSCCGAVEKEPESAFTPSSKRSCTDILFLLAFIGAWAAFIGIFAGAIAKGGSPDHVLRGLDFEGNTCGVSPLVKNQPYAAWPHPAAFMVKICVAHCNATETDPRMTIPIKSSLFSYYCIPNPAAFVIAKGGGIPEDIQVNVKVGGDFQSTTELASRAINDMYVAWVIILISAAIAVIASFLYTWLNKLIGACLVWTCIVLIAAGGFMVSYALLKAASEADDSDLKDRAKAMKVLGWIFVVATIVFILVTFFLRTQIQIAIEVVKEASRAVQDMKMLMFFPIFPLIVAIGFFAWWIATSVYIFSVTDKKPALFSSLLDDPFNTKSSFIFYNPALNDANATKSYWSNKYWPNYPDTTVVNNYTTYDWDQGLKGSFAFVFFHLLWTTQFLIYFTYFVIAGCIANWYFSLRVDGSTHDKQRGDGPGQLSHSPVLSSVYRTMRFHLGTIAVAALLIATIQFIRAVIKYIETRTEQGFCGYKPPEKLRKAIFCLIQCCLYCVQCCLDKISKNALVWTALWGDGFGPAVCSSFKLIWSNLARVAAVNMVGAYLILLGKLLVATVTTGICGIVLLRAQYYRDHLNSPAMPMVAIFLLSFTVATLFMVMYETVVDTIFICFLVDEKVNKGSHNMYASPELIRLVDSHADSSDKLAAKQREDAAIRDSHITYQKKQNQVP